MGLLGLELGCFFLEAKTGEMSKHMTSFTVIFLGWALKSFNVSCIFTFGTSILVLMCTLGIKLLLMLVLHLVTFTAMLFVIWLLWFHRWSFLLVFACWQLCVLVPGKIDLHGMGVTCNLFYVVHSGSGALHPFNKLVHFACRKFIQIYTSITDVSWYKLLILQEKPESVSVKDLGSFWGVFSQIDLCLHCIVSFNYTTVTLPEAYEKVKVGLHFLGLGLAKFFKFSPDCAYC